MKTGQIKNINYFIPVFTMAILLFMLSISSAISRENFDGNFNCAPADDIAAKQCLQMLLDQYVANSETPGAVVLVQTPDFQWTGASGLANIELQTPMQTTDLLRIGSMTKTLVAATVLKLNEEGKISLDAKIVDYLPQNVATSITNSSQITVRQLLNMTSGIYNYTESEAYGNEVEGRPDRPEWSAIDILTYAYDVEESFAPGTDWEYSNTNYILLDLIVAQASQSSLAAEMSRLIFRPLGMDNIFMEIGQPRAGGFGGLLVRGYDEGEDITEINDALGLGDGGLISNAEELAKFLSALLREKTLLSKASLTQMLDFDKDENYGLGISQSETDFGMAWEHNGSTAGFQGDMVYLPEQETIFILLTNDFNTELMEPLFDEILQLVLEPL